MAYRRSVHKVSIVSPFGEVYIPDSRRFATLAIAFCGIYSLPLHRAPRGDDMPFAHGRCDTPSDTHRQCGCRIRHPATVCVLPEVLRSGRILDVRRSEQGAPLLHHERQGPDSGLAGRGFGSRKVAAAKRAAAHTKTRAASIRRPTPRDHGRPMTRAQIPSAAVRASSSRRLNSASCANGRERSTRAFPVRSISALTSVPS